MEVFQDREETRRHSLRLTLMLVLALGGVVIALEGLLLWAMGFQILPATSNLILEPLAHLSLLSALIALPSIVWGGALYCFLSLRRGSSALVESLDAFEIIPEIDDDPGTSRLYEVVEEAALADDLPVPRVYLLDNEQGINALFAGTSPFDAILVVTQGALFHLNRNELRAVVSHALSHVRSGDMRPALYLVSFLHGFAWLEKRARRFPLSMQVKRVYIALPLVAFGLPFIACAAISLLCGHLLKKRFVHHYVLNADDAVRFTGQKKALIEALKKMAAVENGSALTDRNAAAEMDPLLMASGTCSQPQSHPRMIDRIQRLGSTCTAGDLVALRARWQQRGAPDGHVEDIYLGLSSPAVDLAPPPLPEALQSDITLTAEGHVEFHPPDWNDIRRQAGQQKAAQEALAFPADRVIAFTPDAGDGPPIDRYRQTRQLLATLSDDLRKTAHTTDQAIPLLLALLLESHETIQIRQRQEIITRFGVETCKETLALYRKYIADLHPKLFLPLAALIFPALRRQTRSQLHALLKIVGILSRADGRISLFGYCLSQLLFQQIHEMLAPARHARQGQATLREARPEISTLFAIVAREGHPLPAHARTAYLCGMERLFDDPPPYRLPANGVLALSSVWKPLDALGAESKAQLIDALLCVVLHDQILRVEEAELLRTICTMLHCPLPDLDAVLTARPAA